MRLALVALLVLAMPLAGCIKEAGSMEPGNHIRVRDIAVAAPQVTSGSVTLAVNVTLDNWQADSDPVRVVVRAFNTNTGFLVETVEARPGLLDQDKTVPVEVTLEVPREDGYRIEVDVYEDGQVVQEGQVTIRNVGALQPTLHETSLAFGTMDFIVRNVTGNRVVIETKVYLTNEGDGPHRPLDLQVKAREAQTRIIADEDRTRVAGIGPEETQAATVQLEVPDGHNYQIEALLWDGNRTVERGQAVVQLLPTMTQPEGQEIVVSDPQIEDFIRGDRGAQAPSDRADGRSGDGAFEEAQDSTPGPGMILAVLAVAGAALVAHRRWT